MKKTRSSGTTRKTSKKASKRSSKKTSKKASKKKASSRRYGATASKKVGRAMHEAKRGQLRSGRSKKKVRSRKQAIAIGLSEARSEGAKVPPRRSSRSS